MIWNYYKDVCFQVESKRGRASICIFATDPGCNSTSAFAYIHGCKILDHAKMGINLCLPTLIQNYYRKTMTQLPFQPCPLECCLGSFSRCWLGSAAHRKVS